MAASRPHLGKVPLDALTLSAALDEICRLVRAGKGGSVFTPNVDHVVLADQNPELAAAYQDSSLSLVDGVPVLIAGRCLGHSLPEKVSGSDLILPLLERAQAEDFSVYFLGGADGSADLAIERLRQRLPRLRIVGSSAPWIDLNAPADAMRPTLEHIQARQPDLLIVGFGAPKQEIWIHRYGAELGSTVCFGLGASIDFLAGRVRRAPAWISRSGLEWVYRLVQEPRRLARRYLLRDPWFLVIFWRQLRSNRKIARNSTGT